MRKRFAPLYDNGLCLGADLDDEYIENETIEDLIMDYDYSKCFETSNRKQFDFVDECTLNINIDYKTVILKYKEYFIEKRVEFIINLLEKRIGEVKSCFFQNQN